MSSTRVPLSLTLEAIYARCDEIGDCRIWTGALSSGRHPCAQHNGGLVRVRRVVFELSGKPLREGREVGTTCRVLGCVWQGHLAARTLAESRAYHAALGAYSAPASHAAKLRSARERASKRGMSVEKARAIRASSGTAAEIAQALNVSLGAVNGVRKSTGSWREGALPQASVFSFGAAHAVGTQGQRGGAK